MAVNRADKEYTENIWRFDVAHVAGEMHTARLANIHKKAAQAWTDIHGTHERKSRDATLTEGARLLSSAKFAKAALQRQRSEYDDARTDAAEALRAYKAQLERATNPPSDPGEAVLFGEIRNHLRGLPMGERVKVVEQASQAGDTRILRAAVSGPTMVSVLPPERHDFYRVSYLSRVMPDELGRMVRLEAALETIEQGQAQLEAHANQLIDFGTAEAVERSAA